MYVCACVYNNKLCITYTCAHAYVCVCMCVFICVQVRGIICGCSCARYYSKYIIFNYCCKTNALCSTAVCPLRSL